MVRIVRCTTAEAGEGCVLLIIRAEGDPLAIALTSDTLVLRVSEYRYLLPAQQDAVFFGLDFAAEPDVVGPFEAHVEDVAQLVVQVDRAGDQVVEAGVRGTEDEDKTVVLLRKVSRGVETGSAAAGTAIVAGAQVLGRKLRNCSVRVKDRIAPVKAGEEKEVSETARRRVNRARVISGAAVSVTRGLVAGAMTMASSIGSSLSESIRSSEAGQNVAAKAGSKTAAAGDLVVSTLIATGTIIESMLQAATVIVSSAAESSAELVEHKVRVLMSARWVRAW